MLKNMKIATWLMMMLLLLGLMPMGTGAIAFYFMQQNGHSIDRMSTFSDEEAALNRSWRALLQTQTLIDNMAFERWAQTSRADIQQGIDEARGELRSADVAFNLFWETPGLTVSRPDLGEAMKKVYLAQQAVLKQELTLLADTPQTALIERLHAMAAEKRQVRQRLDNQFADYMRATVAAHRLAVEEAEQTQKVFARLLSGTLAAILLLLVAVQRDFRRRLILPLRQIAEHLQKVGRGDLRSEIAVRNNNEIGMLFASLRTMQQELSATVQQVRDGVESINHGTHEIAVGNADLSSRTEEQASALTETAASMEQITATVRQNADNATQAAGMVNQTAGIARNGETLMASAIDKMRAINDSASGGGYYQRDRRHRLPDQHSGAERRRRGRTCRGAGAGFCGGSRRSAQSGAALRDFGQGDQRSGRRRNRRYRRRRAAGGTGGRDDECHRRLGEPGDVADG